MVVKSVPGMPWLDAVEQTAAQNQYAGSLYARVAQAVVVPRVAIDLGGWTPAHNECHGNVTEICAFDPGFTAVRGWLYFDFDGRFGRVQFLAHSVVRAPDGLLYDVTPAVAETSYPFLTADIPDADYAAMVEGGTSRLWHTL